MSECITLTSEVPLGQLAQFFLSFVFQTTLVRMPFAPFEGGITDVSSRLFYSISMLQFRCNWLIANLCASA
jgi:hypothetical protein